LLAAAPYRGGVGRTIDELLEDARGRIGRVTPVEAAAIAEAGGLLVDIRPIEQRASDGEVPGALIIQRNVLEWRLDPASEHRISEVTGHHQPIVIICNEGYASSLAAATLADLGFAFTADVVGGYQAWRAAGLPTERIKPT
jgi:rhodanese-related sulfurtransferase